MLAAQSPISARLDIAVIWVDVVLAAQTVVPVLNGHSNFPNPDTRLTPD